MSDVDEDFFSALALLHSTAEGSAEQLRRMLDACIERKHGRGRTLAVRMPKRFLQRAESSDDSATRASRRRDYAQERATRSELCDGSEAVSLLGTDVADNSAEIADDVRRESGIDREDHRDDDEDVPRISIPDEGTVDGTTVCKVCSGAKLGPLILLECQECQEAYHPLCHQPPVVDVDVYDPRFVWRCGRCAETAATAARTAGRGTVRKARRTSGTIKEDESTSGAKTSERKHDSTENRGAQLYDSPLFAKDLANVSRRSANLSSSTQSRKRIGSKLSVVRAPIK